MRVVFIKKRKGVDIKLTIGKSYQVLSIGENKECLDKWGKVLYSIIDDDGNNGDYTEPYVMLDKKYRKLKLQKIKNESIYK